MVWVNGFSILFGFYLFLFQINGILSTTTLAATTPTAVNQHGSSSHYHHHVNHTHTHTHTHHHGDWDCNRPWPSLQLFMVVETLPSPKHPRYYEIEINFLRSYAYFWPQKLSNTTLFIAYDLETKDSRFIQDLRGTLQYWSPKLNPGWELVGIPPFPYYRKGYDRQEYNMFWADNYTTAEYVGFVDTDTAFVTFVDREDLFEEGKAVINAKGYLKPGLASATEMNWMRGTNRTLHMLEPMTCMAYFPVIVKRSHLKDMRDYLARLHGISFDEVFYHVITADDAYSQFNIMCAYLWKFKRDEYKWYVRLMELTNEERIPNPQPAQDPDLKQFTPEIRFPKPYVCTHARHRKSPSNPLFQIVGNHPVEFNYFLQQGTCYSPPFPHTEPVCEKVRPDHYYYEMHNFDYKDYSKIYPAQQLNEAAAIRYERIKNCTHKWDEKEYGMVMQKIPGWNE